MQHPAEHQEWQLPRRRQQPHTGAELEQADRAAAAPDCHKQDGALPRHLPGVRMRVSSPANAGMCPCLQHHLTQAGQVSVMQTGKNPSDPQSPPFSLPLSLSSLCAPLSTFPLGFILAQAIAHARTGRHISEYCCAGGMWHEMCPGPSLSCRHAVLCPELLGCRPVVVMAEKDKEEMDGELRQVRRFLSLADKPFSS